jgi:hypothetical protein
MTAKDHNKLLSIFFFIQGGLTLIGGVFIVVIYGILGGAMLTTSRRDDEQFMGGIFLVLAVVIGAIMLLFSVFYLLGGYKMLKEQKAGRLIGIIGSCLSLLSFPLGTALGVYGLWFLLGDLGRGLYEQIGNQGRQNSPPPPPNSWQ